MVVLEEFSICNNFKTDCKGKGEFAENDFINYFYSNPNNKGKKLFDVREIKEYQDIDVDFIIDNNGNYLTLPDFNTVLYNKEQFLKIEVKYNSPAIKTGKFAFEMISHSNFVWGFKTKCDYIYVVFGKEEPKGIFNVLKRGIIDFEKWKDFISDRNNYREIYFNKDENIIVNIMTYLKDMKNKKVLNYITQ